MLSADPLTIPAYPVSPMSWSEDGTRWRPHSQTHLHLQHFRFFCSHILHAEHTTNRLEREKDLREMEEVLRSCTSLKAAIILSPIALSCQVEVMHLNFLPKTSIRNLHFCWFCRSLWTKVNRFSLVPPDCKAAFCLRLWDALIHPTTPCNKKTYWNSKTYSTWIRWNPTCDKL